MTIAFSLTMRANHLFLSGEITPVEINRVREAAVEPLERIYNFAPVHWRLRGKMLTGKFREFYENRAVWRNPRSRSRTRHGSRPRASLAPPASMLFGFLAWSSAFKARRAHDIGCFLRQNQSGDGRWRTLAASWRSQWAVEEVNGNGTPAERALGGSSRMEQGSHGEGSGQRQANLTSQSEE
jgi:hypothetical protein